MAGDELARFEAALGAISKMTSEDSDAMIGTRCPKCEASRFVSASDLYSTAVARLEEGVEPADTLREGGLTDLQILERFAPPRRKSVAVRVALVAVPLGLGALYLYRRFGDTIGQTSVAVAIVLTVIVLLKSLRRFSDEYHFAIRRRNNLYMCRQCGQLVAP